MWSERCAVFSWSDFLDFAEHLTAKHLAHKNHFSLCHLEDFDTFPPLPFLCKMKLKSKFCPLMDISGYWVLLCSHLFTYLEASKEHKMRVHCLLAPFRHIGWHLKEVPWLSTIQYACQIFHIKLTWTLKSLGGTIKWGWEPPSYRIDLLWNPRNMQS